MKKYLLSISFAFVVSLGIGAYASKAGTLDDVKAKGFVQCGVNEGVAGFSSPDSSNNWTGLDVDFCRALASAIFNDPKAVKFTPLSAKERFTALQSGEIDILSRNTTWSISRDTSLGLRFAGVMYYDGQGFMINREALKKKTGNDVKSLEDLNGASICTQSGTTTELNLADYFRAHKMTYEVVAFEQVEAVLRAYKEGRCDAYTADQSALYADRMRLQDPSAHIILPEIISKEPLGPVVRQGDEAWFSVVRWVYFALLNAEELGINARNVDEMKNSTNPEIRRVLGVEGDFGKGLGLENDWVARIVKHVGNYGEIFERNLGMATNMKIARGKNALWTTPGGLQYAPPIR